MSQTQKTPPSASQNFTLPDGKILISPAVLCEVLELLTFAIPLMGESRPPRRHWSTIKSYRLYHAKKLIHQALADGNTNRGDV
jgi:hypothetical protein